MYEQVYHHGIPEEALKVIGVSNSTGKECYFKPSEETCKNIRFSFDVLAKRLRELSFLNSGVRILLRDERSAHEDIFQHEGGIRAFVEYLVTRVCDITIATPHQLRTVLVYQRR